VKNLARLLEVFQSDKRTLKIIEALSQTEPPALEKPARIQLKGMVGSQECFVLSGTIHKNKGHHLFIATDKEDAAYIQNTLAGIFEDKSVRFFPDSFRRPMNYEVMDNTNILQRTETINKITTSSGSEIVITYPEALFEKVVAPKFLEEHRIQMKVGEDLDVPTLTDILVEFGFAREEFVYEPGQFSIRGGIVDVFSYGNDYPYRIELFDEEIETIRTFDPTTQLSVQNITKLSIIPNINTKFEQTQKVSLFEVLNENACIWIKDFKMLIDRLEMCLKKASAFSKTLTIHDESELATIFRDRAFIRPDEVIGDIEKHNLLFIGTSKVPVAINQTISYNSKPQPSFNKNFNLLIKNLKANTASSLENFIFTDSPKQVERFYSIFEDLEAHVDFHPITKAIHEGFIDKDLKIVCYTDHQIFQRFHRYRLKKGFTKDKAISLRMLRELKPGDFVTHIDHGVGRFSGLEKIDINGHVQESVRIFYLNNDVLYVSINSLHKITKYVGKEGTSPKLNKLGSDAWKRLKVRTKRKVKDIASELIKLYAKRKASVGHAFPEDGYLQTELEASFLFEDTPDQFKATNDVKADMMKDSPMDRLICGDVGFGKTEIAVRAAFRAVIGGKQVAILVPTTILALQHYRTFTARLEEFGVSVDYINRFRTAKEKREIFEKLKAGSLDIVIGTHGILSKDVGFKDLGLFVIDEEQKFGVAAKEKLRNIKINVDTLTLTATPIPRTLQFSLMAARDLSIIRTPPPNRQPIHTEVRIFSEELIREAVYYEVNRGGQVFFVHNRVKSLSDMAAIIQRLCPDVDVGIAHGQMEAKGLERALLDFIEKKYDVLVCTNIIETGLDIPNANTIIINHAHHFGMSDLHQLRGRVGRSNQKAFCYLFSQPMSVLTSDARKRLKALEEHSELGSGFEIAMRDLDIRGAGNLLGAEQSGFISEIGYETFQRILAEAIQELKETEFKNLFKEELEKERIFVHDVQIDTDIEMLIPDEYVSNIQERLSLYTQLDALNTEKEIENFTKMLVDRFGALPKQVKELFNGLRLRWLCKRMGFDRVILKGNKLRCYFIENPQSPFFESATFNQIMAFLPIGGHELELKLKQSNKRLIVLKEGVSSLKAAEVLLKKLESKLGE
jgi:transcription-repair coupling factor (superfamily II helicase)